MSIFDNMPKNDRQMLGLMALGDAFGALKGVHGQAPQQRALPMAIQMGQQQAEKARKMEAINALLGQGLGAAPTGGGGPQSGLMLPPGANPAALRALAEYNPDLVMQGLAQAQFQQPGNPYDRYKVVPGVGLVDLAGQNGGPGVAIPSREPQQDPWGGAKVVDGRIIAPDGAVLYEPPAAPASPQSPAGRLAADLRSGLIDQKTYDDGIAKLSAGQGFSVTTPDGTVVNYGPNAAGPKLTEQQSKDLVYFERATGAAPTIEKFERELTSWVDNRAEKLPFGFGNYLVSDEFQQGRQAAAEWLAAILRKDTGAAITNQEFELYGPMYLPLPGDGDAVLRQKRAARARAVDAIKRGLGPAQVLTSEYQARGMGLESLTDEQLDELIRLQGGQ